MDDENPFGDPEENPFKNVTVTSPPHNLLSDYDPFAAEEPKTTPSAPAAVLDTTPAVLSTSPAPAYTPTPAPTPTIQPPVPSPSYMSPAPSYGTSSPAAPTSTYTSGGKSKQQEELEQREAEILRREQALRDQTRTAQRTNNFPPLPDKFCVQPCFYQDFDIDIPVEFQIYVKSVYYLWLGYIILLIVNMFASLAYFITTMQTEDTKNSSGVTFGVSLLFVVLFTPCSFVCWYRPAYKAFRSDSSLNFFFFFGVFFMQFCANVILAMGFDGYGTVGIVSGLGLVTQKTAAAKAIGTIMIFVGILFGLMAAADLIMLIRIHRVYRRTGASFEQAQKDFAQGVMSNKTVRNATAQAASSAMQGAMSGSTGTNSGTNSANVY